MHSAYSQYTKRFIPCGQIHSSYSQYTNRFIQHIQQIHIGKFCSKTYLIPHILHICTDSFCIFSVYNIFLPAYSQCIYRFIPHMWRMAQIILIIQNGIIFFAAFKGTPYECVQLDQRLTRNNQLSGSSLTKKILSPYSDNTWNDLRIQNISANSNL